MTYSNKRNIEQVARLLNQQTENEPKNSKISSLFKQSAPLWNRSTIVKPFFWKPVPSSSDVQKMNNQEKRPILQKNRRKIISELEQKLKNLKIQGQDDSYSTSKDGNIAGARRYNKWQPQKKELRRDKDKTWMVVMAMIQGLLKFLYECVDISQTSFESYDQPNVRAIFELFQELAQQIYKPKACPYSDEQICGKIEQFVLNRDSFN